MLEIASVGRDDCTAVDDDVVTNDSPIVNGHVGMNDAVLTYFNMLCHKCTRLNDCALTYLSFRTDHGCSRLKSAIRQDDLVERVKRTTVDDECLSCWAFNIIGIDNDDCRGRIQHSLIVFRMIDESDVTSLYLMKLIESRDGLVLVADNLGRANEISDALYCRCWFYSHIILLLFLRTHRYVCQL